MKKSKLSIALVTSFIAAMALTACDEDVTASDRAIVSFTGYDGKTVEVVSNDMYNKYRDTTDGVTKFYNQILEVLVRYDFKAPNPIVKTTKGYGQIVEEANKKVELDQDQADSNADANGTNYDDEWESILTSKGIEVTDDDDEKEEVEKLKQYYIYNLEKEEIVDGFFEQNKAQLTKEFIGVDDNGDPTTETIGSEKINQAAYPYHIRHILKKVDSGASDYTRNTITATQAKDISSVVKTLADGTYTFGYTAFQYSDDTSASDYGDVGIMTTQLNGGNLGMVKEFQLGIYAYDAIYSTVPEDSDTAKTGLGVYGTYKETGKTVTQVLTDLGVTQVPYYVFNDLAKYAETEKTDDGKKLSEGQSAIYPRNILWNKYLNHHEAFFITNATALNDTGITTGEELRAATLANTEEFNYTFGNANIAYDTSASFTKVEGKPGFVGAAQFGLTDNANAKILVDENNNPIIGVRSEFGIHLMVIQKSIFDKDLASYYTMNVPSDSAYPVDGQGNKKETYVNYIKSNNSTYNTRASAVKEKIKGFDSTYDYRLYELLVNTYNPTFLGNLKDKIADYILRQRESNNHSQQKGINAVWESYIEMLQQEKAARKASRLVPEGCIIGFKDSTKAGKAYEKGGACYYED